MEHDSYMIGRYIGKLHNMMRRSLFRDSSGLGCTAAELRILTLLLNSREPVYQKDIEEEFFLRAPTATGTLQKMEDKGFITREQSDADARMKRIIPTERSLAAEDAILARVTAFEKLISKGISSKDIEHFCRTAEAMLGNLSKKKENTEDK